jgi:vacuolar protein sorting-associated protein VTA1
MSLPQVPSSLSGISCYLLHGAQLEKHDPLMSYHCRYYAVQEGIKLRAAHPDDASKK